MTPTPEREEALRLARTATADGVEVVAVQGVAYVKLARALLAFAADLEAAERRAQDEADLEHQSGRRAYWRARAEAAERDLATARGALEGVIRRGQMGHGMACAWIADDALRSLGEKA